MSCNEDEDDLAAWLEELRSVKPITGTKRVMPEPKKLRRIAVREQHDKLPEMREVRYSPLPVKQVKKLRQQKFPIESRIDLHGMTVERAHGAVDQFIRQAIHNEMRCIEIVTGRGDPLRGTGELRRSLPLWLEGAEIRNFILHIEPNPASRGGSYLVMLRRRSR